QDAIDVKKRVAAFNRNNSDSKVTRAKNIDYFSVSTLDKRVVLPANNGRTEISLSDDNKSAEEFANWIIENGIEEIEIDDQKAISNEFKEVCALLGITIRQKNVKGTS